MKFGGASAPVGAPNSLEILMEQELKDKCRVAVHQTLTTMVRSLVSASMPPEEAIGMIQDQLLAIRKQVETAIENGVKPRGTATDVGVRVDGGAGEATEAQVVATSSPADPEHVADFRRKRGVQPPNQAEYFGEWSDDDTAQYGINPGIPPNHPF